MITKTKGFVTIILIGILFSQTHLLIYCIDILLSCFAWLDGVEIQNTKHPNYVDGNWQPIHNELDRVSVKGEGNIPRELKDGMYARIGANPHCWPPKGYFVNHAFNGFAMIHRIEITGTNEIKFSNSWILGEHLNMKTWRPMQECTHNVGYGDLVTGGYFVFPRLLLNLFKLKLLGKKRPRIETQYPGSTSIVQHAHRTLSCTEVFLPYEISIKKDKVESIGFTDLDGMLKQKSGPKYTPFAAHPIVDPLTKELIFFSMNTGPDALPQMFFGSLHCNGSANRYFNIPTERPIPQMIHDILLTKNYIIMVDGSINADFSRIFYGKGVSYFNHSKPLRFGVMPRHDPSVQSFQWVVTDTPGHVYHTISAWENEDGTITAFMPKFDTYNDIIDIHLSTEKPSYLTKFILDLKTGKASQERLLELVVERPSVNTNIMSPTITYLRSEGDNSKEMGTEMIKYDLKNEKILGRFKCKEECVFGEAFFVQSDGLQNSNVVNEEDDGYLMDLVYHPHSNSSSFIMINAKTMSGTPTFIAALPQRVPYGVHGIWLDRNYFDKTLG